MNGNIVLFSRLIIIFGSLFAIVYTFGVVWRVEKMLDISFKMILGSIIFFMLSEVFSFLNFTEAGWTELASLILKVLFIILFLAGILEMRRMLRKMDGELK
jgi:hypothetical protein